MLLDKMSLIRISQRIPGQTLNYQYKRQFYCHFDVYREGKQLDSYGGYFNGVGELGGLVALGGLGGLG